MSAKNKAIAKLDEAIAFLEDAAKKATDDQIVDMQPFQKLVQEAVAEVPQPGTPEANEFATKLEDLQTTLRNFELDLRQKKGEVERRFNQLNKSQQGASSYEKVSQSVSPQGNDPEGNS